MQSPPTSIHSGLLTLCLAMALAGGADAQQPSQPGAGTAELLRSADTILANAAREVEEGQRTPMPNARAIELLNTLLASSPLSGTAQAAPEAKRPVTAPATTPPPPPRIDVPAIPMPGRGAMPPASQPAPRSATPDAAVKMPPDVPPGFAENLPAPGRAEAREIQTLIAQLRHRDAGERTQAALELALHGATAADAIPALVAALRDPEASVRVAAARGIQGIGFVARVAETAPGLLQALRDPAPTVRAEAARALSEIGPLGAYEPQAIQSLRAARADTDRRVRDAAAEALGYLGY